MPILLRRAARALAGSPACAGALREPGAPGLSPSLAPACFARHAMAAGVSLALAAAAAPAWASDLTPAERERAMARLEEEVRGLPLFEAVRADLERRGFDVMNARELRDWQDERVAEARRRAEEAEAMARSTAMAPAVESARAADGDTGEAAGQSADAPARDAPKPDFLSDAEALEAGSCPGSSRGPRGRRDCAAAPAPGSWR